MKKLGIFLGIVVALVIVAGVALSMLLDANRFKPQLETQLSTALGRQVRLGDLKLSILSGSVAAAELSISDDPQFGNSPFLRAASLNIGAELMPLITSRRLNVTGITIEEPQIDLLQSPTGVWNFSTIGKSAAAPAVKPTAAATASAPLELSVKAIHIHNGKLLVGTTGSKKKPLVLEAVDITVEDFSPTSQFPFSLAAKVSGGGGIKLDGKAGPIATDASATPFGVNLQIDGLDLNGTGLNGAAPDVTGILSLNGSGTSDGSTLRVKGHLKGEKLKFSRNGTPSHTPVELDFEDAHALRKNSGTIQRADAHIGKSTFSLTGKYQEHGDTTDLKLNLNGSGVAATDLASLLPAFGVVLPNGSSIQSGTLNVKLAAEGPADKLVTTGDLALSNTKLANFSLGQKMEAVEKVAGIKSSPDMDIQTASMNVRMAPEGIAAQDIQFNVPAFGNLTGHGTISPANALKFDMTAVVKGATNLGSLTIPFTVSGSSADPVFKPDVAAIAKGELKRVETKAVGGFLNNLLNKKNP